MRRQERHIIQGAAIGFGAVLLVDVLMQWFEHWEEGKRFTWESYDGKRSLKRGAIGGLVGGGIGYGVYQYKLSEEAKLPFNADEYLKKVISAENLKSDPNLYQKVLGLRNEIKKILAEKFIGKLIDYPQDTGSFIKGTAINSSYDLDIMLPFHKYSYDSLEVMYSECYEMLEKSFGDNATITMHTKAIGVSFAYDDQVVHFDIVPGREINDYKKDKDLNLYVKPNWFWERGGSFKTNLRIQQEIIQDIPEFQRVIKLLKAYKIRTGFQLPNVLIEQATVEALSEKKYGIHKSDYDNFLNVLCYIVQILKRKSFIDYANSNNNLLDKVSDMAITSVITQLESDIHKAEENPRFLIEIFEINN